ncbi:hypothetical protein HanRHA438_Chr09g0380231 [Helianthus annuus]|nr:hypothetical protein HanRHA438_Chr09g0380231 [Helianthus annuus]
MEARVRLASSCCLCTGAFVIHKEAFFTRFQASNAVDSSAITRTRRSSARVPYIHCKTMELRSPIRRNRRSLWQAMAYHQCGRAHCTLWHEW